MRTKRVVVGGFRIVAFFVGVSSTHKAMICHWHRLVVVEYFLESESFMEKSCERSVLKLSHNGDVMIVTSMNCKHCSFNAHTAPSRDDQLLMHT